MYKRQLLTLPNIQTWEILCSWLIRTANSFIDLFTYNDIKHANAIHQATLYIRQHYAEKITLNDVSYTHLASRGDDEPLTAEELKDSELVTGQDQYYTEPEMRPSDLNTYVPSAPTYRPIIDDTDNGTCLLYTSRAIRP